MQGLAVFCLEHLGMERLTIKNKQFINKVLYGDCLEWMPQIEDKSVDMILCDLPYGISNCKWDSIIPFEALWNQYKRVIKDNGAIILTASQPFTSALVMSNPKWFKYEWIWDKVIPSGHLNAKRMPLKYHENILVFYKKQCTYNRQFTEKPLYARRPNRQKISESKDKEYTQTVYGNFKHLYADDYDDTVSNPKSILRIDNPKGSKKKRNVHPTQKPVSLFEYLIKTYTNEGETVLDNCLGSGTTAVACINTDRNFIGIEKEWDYCEISNKRVKEAYEMKIS